MAETKKDNKPEAKQEEAEQKEAPRKATLSAPQKKELGEQAGPLEAALGKVAELLDDVPGLDELQGWQVYPNVKVTIVAPSFAKYSFTWDELGLRASRSKLPENTLKR